MACECAGAEGVLSGHMGLYISHQTHYTLSYTNCVLIHVHVVTIMAAVCNCTCTLSCGCCLVVQVLH